MAKSTDTLGRFGENLVKTELNAIHWSANDDADDFGEGVDLFLWPRSQAGKSGRLTSLNVVLTAQVKTGDSYFVNEFRSESTKAGWWYYDEDLADLATRATPHILILVEKDKRACYWEHVSPSTLTAAGSGWKVLVPRHQTIGKESEDLLLQVARTGRPSAISLEGSIFNKPESRPSSRKAWRTAILASRLVAPHGNWGPTDPMGPIEACALVMLGQDDEWARYAQAFEEVPAPATSESHPEWGWRFVAWLRDFRDWPETPLRPPPVDPPSHAIVAWTIGREISQRRHWNPTIEEIPPLTGNVDALDRSWLHIHRSLRQRLDGEPQAALDSAKRAMKLIGTRDDPVAGALRAAAATALRSVDWQAVPLKELIAAIDSRPTWWRAQRWAGLAEDLIRQPWEDRSTLYSYWKPRLPHEQARTLAFAAEMAGDSAYFSSRANEGLSLFTPCSRHGVADHRLSDGLAVLVLSEADKAVENVVLSMYRGGPLQPLREQTLRIISSNEWPLVRHSVIVKVVAHGADLVGDSGNTDAISWCIRELEKGMDRQYRQPSTYQNLCQALSSLGPYASEVGRTMMMDWILAALESLDDLDSFLDICLPRVIRSIKVEGIDAHSIDRLATQGSRDVNSQIGVAIRVRLAEQGRQSELNQLRGQFEAGNLQSGLELWRMGVLSAVEVLPRAQDAVRGARSEASKGTHVVGAHNPYLTLLALNLDSAEQVDWEPIVHGVSSSQHDDGEKAWLLETLSWNVQELPEDVKQWLRGSADSFDAVEFMWSADERSLGRNAARLKCALGLSPELEPSVLAASYDEEDRILAADLAWHQVGRDIGRSIACVLSLCSDHEPSVRGRAGAILAKIVGRYGGDNTVEAGLISILRSRGATAPAMAANAIKAQAGTQELPSSLVEELAQISRHHLSARVRRAAESWK